MRYLLLLGSVGVLLGQEQWKAFRPNYPSPVLISSEVPRREPGPIQVQWKPSPSAQALYEKVLQQNRTAVLVPGYRIQVVATSVRAEADSVRFFLLENFPEQSVYMIYEVPLFKVRAGDFLERREAEMWLQRYKQAFPGAFIVPDKVMKP
ncbi:MAG: SPOR domain-containing protein [Bacteroidia bacterium]|nr:SPOR domain-containing protein [Bacteroidia bacterium]MCX7763626.1 SPOR domain-containing protein [Bacteroidia bacterium]MDW8056720.1 SPOR domain-containing protein [Bacteroidia bacterium]